MQFMHRHITQPALTEGDTIAKAANDLATALKGKNNWLEDEQKHDLQCLSKIFSKVAATKSNSPQPPTTLANQETHPNLRAAQLRAL